jgi:hypothetical protein
MLPIRTLGLFVLTAMQRFLASHTASRGRGAYLCRLRRRTFPAQLLH